jgi:hypothetical protein
MEVNMKKFMILAAIGLVAISMAGCAEQKVDANGVDEANTTIETNVEKGDAEDCYLPSEDGSEYVTSTEGISIGEVITVGNIMSFNGDTIHIITGDLVQPYKFDSNQTGDFYIGQSVQLVKGEGIDRLEPFTMDDFGSRYTSMGQMLDEFSGEITELTDDSITVMRDDMLLKLSLYSKLDYEVGDNVSLYYFSFSPDDEASVFDIYNEDTKLDLVVNGIARSEEGHMILDMGGANGAAYTVDASSCYLELNMSEVKVGDVLSVYHDGIMESDPMQVRASLIRK